jgi:predicted glycosyltransferase involved in capsule biosynthesis
MEPSYFFLLIVPLAILVVFLVGLVLYHARKEEDDYENELKKLRQLLFSGKLDKKNFIRLRNRLKHEKVFAAESDKLLSLLSDEKIDQGTYVRLRQVLETSFRDRLDKLDEKTNEIDTKEPFDASKF